jgi:hypothetical protein
VLPVCAASLCYRNCYYCASSACVFDPQTPFNTFRRDLKCHMTRFHTCALYAAVQHSCEHQPQVKVDREQQLSGPSLSGRFCCMSVLLL